MKIDFEIINYRNYLFVFLLCSLLSSCLIFIGISYTKVLSIFMGSSGVSGYIILYSKTNNIKYYLIN